MECSEPGLMRDEELLAYLAGERVSPAVEQHLAQCPRCSTRVADYRRQELALLSKLYRWDCPPNQVLGEYQLGLLAADTALAVKHHLLACVHCSAELSILSEFLQSDPVLVQRPAPAPDPEPARQNHHALPQQPGALLNRLLDHAGTSTRRIIAALLPPAPRLAYQRNATPTTSWPRRYTAEDFTISLQAEHTGARADTLQLIGFVAQKDAPLHALQGIPVVLTSQSTTASTQNIDELGNFVFSSLVPALYTLELQTRQGTIVIEQIDVNTQV